MRVGPRNIPAGALRPAEATLILLAFTAAAGCPTGDSLVQLREESRSAIEADDLAEHAVIWARVERQLPCESAPVDALVLTGLLVDRALGLRAAGGDWKAPMSRALAIDPDVEAPEWMLEDVRAVQPLKVDPSPTPLLVDGISVEGSPTYAIPRLFQRPDGEGHLGTSAPPEWTRVPRAPIELALETTVGLSLGLTREAVGDRGFVGPPWTAVVGHGVLSGRVDLPVTKRVFASGMGQVIPQTRHFDGPLGVGIRLAIGAGWAWTANTSFTAQLGVVGVPLGKSTRLTLYPCGVLGMQLRDESWLATGSIRAFPGMGVVDGFAARRIDTVAVGIEVEYSAFLWSQEFDQPAIQPVEGRASDARIGLGVRWSPPHG